MNPLGRDSCTGLAKNLSPARTPPPEQADGLMDSVSFRATTAVDWPGTAETEHAQFSPPLKLEFTPARAKNAPYCNCKKIVE